MARGYLYLVTIMDHFSRYVLAWRLFNTLDAVFCVEALEEALGKAVPQIFNTYQGGQFTSDAFTGMLLEKSVELPGLLNIRLWSRPSVSLLARLSALKRESAGWATRPDLFGDT